MAGMALMGASTRIGTLRAAERLQRAQLGPPQPFSFDGLKTIAVRAAAAPYQPPPQEQAKLLEQIDYDTYFRIRFRPELSLFSDEPAAPSVRLFPPGRYSKDIVSFHLVEGTNAREVIYSPDYFDFPADSPFAKLPANFGFSGFRVLNDDAKGDWLAYQGVSYFRSSGPLDQYGQSARGIAINVATPTPEEFPRFTAYWIELQADRQLVLYALLDGPSITGAYRFVNKRSDRGVTQEIECALYMRKSVERLGIAPLTSMFWYGENNRIQAADWRPEIHDTDGLALWTGAGERLWRPLLNPPRVQTNSFFDNNPQGYGLLQRDRSFQNFEDDGVFYNRRPSAWIEPLGGWGRGAVQLVEIPTGDEIHDNIVAYWVPAEPAVAGKSFKFRYRLHWLADEPFPGLGARNVALRTGVGGIPGQPLPPGLTRLVYDFEGAKLQGLDAGSGVIGVVQASRGEILNQAARPVVGTPRWRLMFDLKAEGAEPVDLRVYLARGPEALTETCLYQVFPGKSAPISPQPISNPGAP